MSKALGPQKIQIGSTSYVISSHPTPASHSSHVYSIPKQPFSIHLGRKGHVEITFDNKAVKPVVNVTHATGHSAKHEEHAHSSSSRYPKPPRSDAATIGSSTYLRAPTSQAPQYTHSSNSHSDRYHAQPREHKTSSSTPRHQTHSVSRSPQDPRRLLDVSNAPNDHQHSHYKTSPRVVKRASVPTLNVPRTTTGSSPQKHAHFALPQSVPNQSNLTTRVPPPQSSRHHHTRSHESYFRHPPQGWFNRRGDEFIQRGVIKRQPRHLEWDIIFAKYPDPGTGWMNAEGHFLPPAGGILKHSPGQ